MLQHNVDTYKLHIGSSKKEQGVSFAVYSENFRTSKGVSNCTPRFTAILFEVLEAINYGLNVVEENFLLVTDFKCSMQAI